MFEYDDDDDDDDDVVVQQQPAPQQQQQMAQADPVGALLVVLIALAIIGILRRVRL